VSEPGVLVACGICGVSLRPETDEYVVLNRSTAPTRRHRVIVHFACAQAGWDRARPGVLVADPTWRAISHEIRPDDPHVPQPERVIAIREVPKAAAICTTPLPAIVCACRRYVVEVRGG
jgi:hypothetical protein